MLEYITTLNTGRETSRKNYKNRDNDAENMKKKRILPWKKMLEYTTTLNITFRKDNKNRADNVGICNNSQCRYRKHCWLKR